MFPQDERLLEQGLAAFKARQDGHLIDAAVLEFAGTIRIQP